MSHFVDLRKSKRKNFKIEMFVESMYKQDNEKIENIDANIEILNISRGGVGLFCTKEMPLDYYFKADIVFDEEHHFKSVLKIIRKDKNKEKEGFDYGCIFVGLAEILAKMIDEFNNNN